MVCNFAYFLFANLLILLIFCLLALLLKQKQKGHLLPQKSFTLDGWTDRYRGKGYNTITVHFWEDGWTIGTFNLGLLEWEASFKAAISAS